MEMAREENFALIRIGLYYGWELPNEFEFTVNLMTDFKIDGYTSWILGFGIGKKFLFLGISMLI